MYTTHGTDYYVTVDLTAKTVNVKVTVGFLSKVNVDANLDLVTGRIDFKGNATDNDAYGLLSKVHSTDMYSIFDGLIKAHTSVTLDLKTRKFVSEGTPDSSMLDLLDVAKGENMYDIYDSVFGISALWGIREDTTHTHTSLCTLTDGTAFSFDGEKLFRISRGSYVVENIRY